MDRLTEPRLSDEDFYILENIIYHNSQPKNQKLTYPINQFFWMPFFSTISNFKDFAATRRAHVDTWVRKNDELVRRNEDKNTGLELTSKGTDRLRVATTVRDYNAAFYDAMEEELLRWTYTRTARQNNPEGLDPYPLDMDFYGRKVTLDDVERAANSLHKQGLIQSNPGATHVLGMINVTLTLDGEECAEDFDYCIRIYKNKKGELATASGPTINIDNFNGGSLSVGNQNTLGPAANTPLHQRTSDFAKTIKRVLPELSLGDLPQDEAFSYVSDLEIATDPTRVRRSLEWVEQLASSSSGDIMTEMLSAKASEILQEMFK